MRHSKRAAASVVTSAVTFLLLSCTVADAPEVATDTASTAGGASSVPPWEWTDDQVMAAVNQIRAGRNLTPASWPGGARVAVLLSFDVDNETVYGLRDGEVSIGPLSQGEYGHRVALPRVLRLLERERIPASFFFPAWSLKIAPHQADLVDASGMHEIAAHGWIHERNAQLDADTERRLLEQAVATITEMTGRRPVGYRAPSWNMSPATLSIVRDLGFLYESSLMADDGPYEILADGQPTGMVEIPVEWILDDAPLLNPRGQAYSTPREMMQVWIDEFDKAWEERTMFVLTMHPHVIGHRSRIVALEGLIDHIQAKGNAWFATHEAAARWVREQAGM